MDDLSIIELYYMRNEQAIKETDIKYGKLCFSLANNILYSREDSEECVNDTYLSVWNTIPPTRPNNFMAFICKIVRNLSMKKLDFNLALNRTKNVTVSFSELEEILPDNQVISDSKFFDSVNDIAERYSFTESKVKNMLYHSRNRLKFFLKKEGIEV